MCNQVCKAVKNGNVQVLKDIQRIVKEPNYIPTDFKELCGKIFVTCYMGTENSSAETRERAANLSKDIGSYHLGLFLLDFSTVKVIEFVAGKYVETFIQIRHSD